MLCVFSYIRTLEIEIKIAQGARVQGPGTRAMVGRLVMPSFP